MTYKRIEKRNTNLLNICKMSVIGLSILHIYYSGFMGIFLTAYLIFIYMLIKKDIKTQREKIVLKNEDIIFYNKISIFKSIRQMAYYNVIFISFLTILATDFDSIPKDIFPVVILVIIVLVGAIYLSYAYRYTYNFIAFDEGFICRGDMFYYKDIQKFQAIKTKTNDYIIELADKTSYASTRLNTHQYNQFKTLLNH